MTEQAEIYRERIFGDICENGSFESDSDVFLCEKDVCPYGAKRERLGKIKEVMLYVCLNDGQIPK